MKHNIRKKEPEPDEFNLDIQVNKKYVVSSFPTLKVIPKSLIKTSTLVIPADWAKKVE